MSLTASRILSAEDIRVAAAAIPRTRPFWQGEEGPRVELTISPGMVRLARRDPNLAERALQRRFGERADEVRALRAGGLYPGGMTGAKRAEIKTFTRQSRARMVRTLCTLDFTPLFAEGRQPAMVTLTLPGEWEKIAPTSKEFATIVNRFRSHYAHSWGKPFTGVWKREFQRRGAPHLHILTTPPAGLARGTALDFRQWLSLAWAGACRTAEVLGPIEAEKHVAAGTGIDYDTRGQWIDAKRIAIYYAKHGLYGAKEYQNRPPALWADSGAVGRFWGSWGLRKGGTTLDLDMRRVWQDPAPEKRLAEVVEKCQKSGIDVSERLLSWAKHRLSSNVPHEYASLDLYVSRWLRKQARKQSYFERVQVTRLSVNPATGDVKERKRWVKRRRQFYTGGSGFLVINDGAAAAEQLAKLVTWWVQATGHEAEAFTMYEQLHAQHTRASLAE